MHDVELKIINVSVYEYCFTNILSCKQFNFLHKICWKIITFEIKGTQKNLSNK